MPLTPHPDGYPIKIVRDRTAEIVNPSGDPGELFYGPLLEGESRAKWLTRKLGEEAIEYVQEPGVGELVQVLQVVMALASEHDDLNFDKLITLAMTDKRGGFFDCVMMYGRHPEYDR